MAASTQLNSSAPAAADQAGNAQLDTTVAVLTLNGETITSCTIDSVQAKVASTQLNSSAPAAADQAGNAQLDTTVAVLTLNGETITSCTIDSVQAKVAFDSKGAITSDVSAPVATKNQLGEGYGMKAWGGAIAEWDQQTAAFCAYVTGKTAQEVTGIAVDAATKPTEADLATSVTISIGGFWDQQTAAFCAYVTGKTAQEVTGIAVDAATKPTEADLATSVTISIGGFQALVEKAAQN